MKGTPHRPFLFPLRETKLPIHVRMCSSKVVPDEGQWDILQREKKNDLLRIVREENQPGIVT